MEFFQASSADAALASMDVSVSIDIDSGHGSCSCAIATAVAAVASDSVSVRMAIHCTATGSGARVDKLISVDDVAVHNDSASLRCRDRAHVASSTTDSPIERRWRARRSISLYTV